MIDRTLHRIWKRMWQDLLQNKDTDVDLQIFALLLNQQFVDV